MLPWLKEPTVSVGLPAWHVPLDLDSERWYEAAGYRQWPRPACLWPHVRRAYRTVDLELDSPFLYLVDWMADAAKEGGL